MFALGVLDGNGNATVISSESCVHAYGGGFGGEAGSGAGAGAGACAGASSSFDEG